MTPTLSARGYLREGSLASKLATLAPGETLYLDDPRDGPNLTPLDRVVQSTVAKSAALKGRRFKTQGGSPCRCPRSARDGFWPSSASIGSM